MSGRLVSSAALLALLASGALAQSTPLLRFTCASFPLNNGGVHEAAIDGPSSIVNQTFATALGDACGSICPGATFQINTVTSDIPGFTAALIGLSSPSDTAGTMQACLTQGLNQTLASAGAALDDDPQSSVCTGIVQIGAPVKPTGAALSSSSTPNLGDSLTTESGATLLVSAVVHKGPAPQCDFDALPGMVADLSATLAAEVDSRGVLRHPSGDAMDVAFYVVYDAQLGQGVELTEGDWNALLGSAASILVFNQASEVTMTFEDSDGAPAVFLTVGGADI